MREKGSLGAHPMCSPLAKTKHEVAALLCMSALEAGLWPVPEFEITDVSGCLRHIDVVWAVRDGSLSGMLWRPIAAFEIEGHGVARARGGVKKDVASLAAASALGAMIVAIVLFQVSPGGKLWRPVGTRTDVEDLIQEFLGTTSGAPPVVLDEELEERIPSWIRHVVGG